MQKFVKGLAILALAAIAIPSFAATASRVDDPMDRSNPSPSQTRTNDCLGTVVWDSGMFDEFTPPTGCSSAGSAGCFVAALNDGGFPPDGRRLADDFISNGMPVTGIKIWNRYNQQGYDYHLLSNGLHGFCVKIYQPADPTNPWCPDGTVAGEDAIGTIVYDQYVSNFTEYEITTGLPRNFNVCLNLPTPFTGVAGNTYFVSVSADFDFTTSPDGTGVTQWFWRLYEGIYDPWCESMWWDTWNDPATNWEPTSVALALPCWAGWNQSLVLYSNGGPADGACCFTDGSCGVLTADDCAAQGGSYQGDGTVCSPSPCPPVPVAPRSWGQIKNQYK